MFGDLVFRQLFDAGSSLSLYLLGDPQTRKAVIIDTVFEQHRDRALVEELGPQLVAVLDTHCHADHVTRCLADAAGHALPHRHFTTLRRCPGCRSLHLEHGDPGSPSAAAISMSPPPRDTPSAASATSVTTAVWPSPATA